MEHQILIIGILFGVILVFNHWVFRKKRERRRSYYRNEYLKSDDWKRKRYVVLKRDNWRCVYCGAPATQVHHKKYAKRNIGREPIDWLVSVCNSCHESQHTGAFIQYSSFHITITRKSDIIKIKNSDLWDIRTNLMFNFIKE